MGFCQSLAVSKDPAGIGKPIRQPMKEQRPTDETIFDAARKLTDPAQRKAYLDQVCAGDAGLRQRIEALLGATVVADRFFGENLDHLAPRYEVNLAAALPTEKAGDRIGRYKLLEQVGEGGFGTVWMAEQEEPVRRRVALKVIKLGMDTRQVVARFQTERQALAMMDHSSIAHIYDGGTTDSGRPYFVMELVSGMPITRYCEDRRLPMRERLDLFAQVCQAVQHAHQQGIIHCDLKPSNILVAERDGRAAPKVIDFGIAKATAMPPAEKTRLTRSWLMAGTPAYMSPEQAGLGGAEVDARSDVYSLGVLLYELLTGRTPFVAESPLDILVQALESEAILPSAINPETPEELEQICLRCLEKSPQHRYESAAALANDLEGFLRGDPINVRRRSRRAQVLHWVRYNPALASHLAALAVCLAISESNYLIKRPVRPGVQFQIILALALWGAACGFFQNRINRASSPGHWRLIWTGADSLFLTEVLLIVQAINGPLLGLFPVLIAMSGLWLRASLVGVTTGLAALGYGLLLTDEYLRSGGIQRFSWHLILLIAQTVSGLTVAYLVHRVRALSRFHESRART
jgi:serine/threonine protein kinase